MIWFHLIVEIVRKGNTSCSVKVGMLVIMDLLQSAKVKGISLKMI